MGKFVLILLTALATALAITNPSQESHQKAVYTAIAAEASTSQSLGRLAGSMLGRLDPMPYEYHNYFLFSTLSLENKTVSVGALNRIWKRQ